MITGRDLLKCLWVWVGGCVLQTPQHRERLARVCEGSTESLLVGARDLRRGAVATRSSSAWGRRAGGRRDSQGVLCINWHHVAA